MKIKLNPKNTSKMLWVDSPCTLNNVIQNPSIDNALRFHYGSIYFKDEVNRPKKVFTQFQKPELLLLNFRRQIDEATARAKKLARAKVANNPSQEKKMTMRHTTKVQANRFYEKPEKLEFKHDKHGNRSSYIGDYDVKSIQNQLKQTKRNFYSSQRVDLSRPHNFFPGPGTYFSQQQKRPFRHTFTQRMTFHTKQNKRQTKQYS